MNLCEAKRSIRTWTSTERHLYFVFDVVKYRNTRHIVFPDNYTQVLPPYLSNNVARVNLMFIRGVQVLSRGMQEY